MQNIIKKLSEKIDLTQDESHYGVEQIITGEISPAQTAAFLVGLKLKGETIDEIVGAAEAVRDRANKVELDHEIIFDNCGTGGDGANTFNISTAAAFVVAACGITVAKHGNRSVSSKCGSADVLEYLGANLNLTNKQVTECIDTTGIGFLFAPNFHPAMKNVAPVRRELGIRTIFNLLGPLTNPANASHQLIGVFSESYIEKIATVAMRLGIKNIMVVHNESGIDEITTTDVNRIIYTENHSLKHLSVMPNDYGFKTCSMDEIKGGNVEDNAKIIKMIFNGHDGPKKDTVILSAAVSLVVAERVRNIDEGIAMAHECIDSGAAMNKLEAFINFTRKYDSAR